MNIAINGFGRIGRLFMRSMLERGESISIVAVNDLASSKDLAYLFKFDTHYGRFDGEVTHTDDSIIVDYRENRHSIKVFSQRNPADLPWKELAIDLVVECTGFFLTQERAMSHIIAGAKRVLLSAPAKTPEIATVVLGVNTVKKGDIIVSNASCTTNCVTPAIFALNNALDVASIAGVTIHAYTASQNLQDGPNEKMRTGRAAAINIVPTTTGAANATISVIPELKGKLSLRALRVPVVAGSYVYLSFNLNEDVTREGVIKILSDYQLNNPSILLISDAPLVSSDIIATTQSTIVDLEMLQITGPRQFELGLWYDNEWGYTNRLVDVAIKMVEYIN